VDLATGAARRLPPHPTAITTIAVSPDGKWVASGSVDGLVRLSPIAGGDGRALHNHDGRISDLKFSRDGRWLLSLAGERTALRLWQVDGDATRALAIPSNWVSLDLSPDDALAVFAHHDGEVSV